MNLTTEETATLIALCNFHIRSLTNLLRNGELSAHGREQYGRDIITTERLIEKLRTAGVEAAA